MKRLSTAAALVLLGTLLYAAPPAVSANSTCVRSGAVMKVSIASANAVTIKRDGNAFVVKGGGIGDTTCGNAKVTNVNTIKVTGTSGNNTLTLDFSAGLFAPGLTPELDVEEVSEIELALDFKGGSDRLIVKGGSGPDVMEVGINGINVNDDVDPDVGLSGLEDLRLVTGAGEDTVSGFGGDATFYPYDGALTLDTGDDNDTIVTGYGVDTVRAGSGDDTITAPSDEVTDTVGCGSGSDTVVSLEARDLTTGCENIQTVIESEPNNKRSKSNVFPSSATSFRGDHGLASDVDFLTFTLMQPSYVRLLVFEDGDSEICATLGVDSYLTVYDVNGVEIAADDDSGPGDCSAIDGVGNPSSPLFGLAAGTYFVELKAAPKAVGDAAEFVYLIDVTIEAVATCGSGHRLALCPRTAH